MMNATGGGKEERRRNGRVDFNTSTPHFTVQELLVNLSHVPTRPIIYILLNP